MLSVSLCKHVAFTTSSLVPASGRACLSFKRREKLFGGVGGGHLLAQEGTLELVAEAEIRQQVEGRMSPLHDRERSGKLVRAR